MVKLPSLQPVILVHAGIAAPQCDVPRISTTENTEGTERWRQFYIWSDLPTWVARQGRRTSSSPRYRRSLENHSGALTPEFQPRKTRKARK